MWHFPGVPEPEFLWSPCSPLPVATLLLLRHLLPPPELVWLSQTYPSLPHSAFGLTGPPFPLKLPPSQSQAC